MQSCVRHSAVRSRRGNIHNHQLQMKCQPAKPLHYSVKTVCLRVRHIDVLWCCTYHRDSRWNVPDTHRATHIIVTESAPTEIAAAASSSERIEAPQQRATISSQSTAKLTASYNPIERILQHTDISRVVTVSLTADAARRFDTHLSADCGEAERFERRSRRGKHIRALVAAS